MKFIIDIKKYLSQLNFYLNFLKIFFILINQYKNNL